jgi:hypothetical protein
MISIKTSRRGVNTERLLVILNKVLNTDSSSIEAGLLSIKILEIL